jgi:hypothetical protein
LIVSTTSDAAKPAANGNAAATAMETWDYISFLTAAALYFFHLILAERFADVIQTTSLVPLTQGI